MFILIISSYQASTGMRLYLSSFLFGNYPQKFAELVAPGNRAALILNALDNREMVRQKFLESQTSALTNLGFTVEELDLRCFFGRQNELKDALGQANSVWVNGGNSFLLRRAMKQSGFDVTITDLLLEDKIVYGGFSAGVVVLSPSLRGLEIIDDPFDVSDDYESETLWDGLGIIDFSIGVHYQSNHPESRRINEVVEYYKEHNIPYKTLRDGEVLIKKGNNFESLV
ncbi:MAG TPA: Type 1 glutamine amidotransferase-like domain-containing protein [Pyrinomonadaceae bacterium]